MEYEPPVIDPVTGSIVAPSVGESTKENVPPSTPKTVAVAPSQVAVNSNNELSINSLLNGESIVKVLEATKISLAEKRLVML